jgi:hypothetical protein
MKPSDRKGFTVAIQALAVAFGRESETPLFEAYWQGLHDLTLQQVNKAAMAAMRQCRFMPKPVELRELAGCMTNEVRSLRAWAAVLDAIPAVGSYQSVNFSDPLTNLAVRLTGGWRHLCGLSSKELGFARRVFEAHYQGLLVHPPAPEDCSYLPGRSELENIADGQEVTQGPIPFEVKVPGAKLQPALPPQTVKQRRTLRDEDG